MIAIDGQAYVGKSHIARELSRLTGFEYINTGHMFRALAHMANRKCVDLKNESALMDMPFEVWFEAGDTFVSEGKDSDGAEKWTQELERPEIVQAASQIAIHPKVREKLANMQRGYAKKSFILMEGRDIGTAVFPDAICKVYLSADDLVRAKRLYKTLSAEEKVKNEATPEFIQQLLEEKLRPIDHLDTSRKVSPLISKEDARKLGYYIHDSLEHYTVLDDARMIYDNYIQKELKKIGIHR